MKILLSQLDANDKRKRWSLKQSSHLPLQCVRWTEGKIMIIEQMLRVYSMPCRRLDEDLRCPLPLGRLPGHLVEQGVVQTVVHIDRLTIQVGLQKLLAISKVRRM